MSYFLDEDQRHIRDLAQRFARQEVEPLANQIDHDERTPTHLVRKAAELGFFGLCIPETYGGSGASLTTACVVLEEIAKASPAFAGLLSVQMVLCPLVVLEHGNDEQKRRLLPPSARGEKLMAYSSTEPAGAANWPAHLTRLRPEGDHWRLDGAKLFCTQGEATTYLVMCKNERNGQIGHGCAVVERGVEGFEIAPYQDKLGWRGTNTGGLSFNNVRVRNEDVLGDLLAGGTHPLANMSSFIGHAATSLGCAQGLFDKTLAQVKDRQLYGVPMHRLSPVSHRLANVHNKLQAMRSLLYTATRLTEEGRHEHAMAIVCKAWICDTAFDCTHTLLQMWGGSGVMNSTGVNRYFRDARAKMVAEGATEMHTAIIAENLLGLRPSEGAIPFG